MRARDKRIVRFENFRFAAKNEHDGAPSITDIEGFVVLVEHQDGFVHTRTAHDEAKVGRPRTRQSRSVLPGGITLQRI